jgi:hypothetical protein
MFVAKVPNRTSLPLYLLRENKRVDDKVKTSTLANLTHLPSARSKRFRLSSKVSPSHRIHVAGVEIADVDIEPSIPPAMSL